MAALQHPLEGPINVMTATAADLRQLLDAGKYTSVDLVQLYFDQISKHNHKGMKLHAITTTAPVESCLKSPLHGIPITLKDFFLVPSFGMETTCGSFALKGLNAADDAAIATSLRDAGCLVIALANLSEWANCRGANLTSGWSAVGGQTQSPYVLGGVDPNDKWLGHSTSGGLSSGSAVGTAAGFSALSIGSESDGSIVQPAIRAALDSMKGSVGTINMKGTMSGGAGFDSAGPIAKSVGDCASVMDVLLPGRDFRSHLTKSWEGIRIAYLDYKTWQFEDWICDQTPAFDEEHEAAMINALKTAEGRGAKVSYDAKLLLPGKIMEKYETVPMGSLYNFNTKLAELELPQNQPSQISFESGLEDKMTDEEYMSGLKHLRQSFRAAVEEVFQETGASVIMASGESFLTTIAAGAGYPIANVPLGMSSYNGRPHGMEIVARDGEEGNIFKVMSAWETAFPEARKPHPALVKWDFDSQL